LQYYSLYPRYTVRQNLEFPLKSKIHSYPQAEIDSASPASRRCCASSTCSTARPTSCPAARCSAFRSAAPSCASRASSSWTSRCRTSTPSCARALRSELKDLQMNLKATFLFVTHDQIEAMSMGDKVGVLNNGKLIQVGTPYEIYNDPRDTFVAALRRLAGR
jgi:multiple sugar transport system ATP-binding protein